MQISRRNSYLQLSRLIDGLMKLAAKLQRINDLTRLRSQRK